MARTFGSISGKHSASFGKSSAVIISVPNVDQRVLDQKEADIERFGAAHLVIGDDWKNHPRYEQVRGYRGVEIHYLPRTPGISSTQLREQMASAPGEPHPGDLSSTGSDATRGS